RARRAGSWRSLRAGSAYRSTACGPTATRHGWVLWTDGARAAVASIAVIARGGMRRGGGSAAAGAIGSSRPVGAWLVARVMALTCPCSGVRIPCWRGAPAGARVLGPDAGRLYAAKDGRLITAWTAGELAADIRREEAGSAPDRAGPIP